ncbi:MAG: V-type ATP synthase subunit K [Kiritimatiellaeota bacterium]|nr:V-type ATP synthase subunit K [Kiritimatiellota bacterium]
METAWGVTGAVMCLALCAAGSAMGTGVAAASAVGAWKKCYAQNKQAPFLLLSFVGVPLSQTLYGMILMFAMLPKAAVGVPLLVLGAFAGFAVGLSAFLQGKAAAAAADAQADTGQGLANYLAALGIIETAAIFVMVFTFTAIRRIPV